MTSTGYPESLRNMLLGDLRLLSCERTSPAQFPYRRDLRRHRSAVRFRSGPHSRDIDAVCSHGQTLVHLPEADHPVIPCRATLQIGEISVIAQRTGILTIGDFRPADMAQGGQGAPLVPYVDYLLIGHPTLGRIMQNIGGIGNLTYIPPGCSPDAVIAFDTGPGNMVVDAVVSIVTEAGTRWIPAGGWRCRNIHAPLTHCWTTRTSGSRLQVDRQGHNRYSNAHEAHRLGCSKPEDIVAAASELTVRP